MAGGVYITEAQVTGQIPYRDIGASTEPSTDDLTDWILEAEALLDSTLASIGVAVPVTGTQPVMLMRAWAIDYPVGKALIAFASAGGDGSNEDGESHLERFWARYKDMNDNPGKYAQIIAQGEGPSTSRRVRSHIVDHPDGNTVSGGDFLPKFTRDDYN